MHLILLRAGARAGWLAVVICLALAGCASAPSKVGGPTTARTGGDAGRDGPDASPPSGLDRIPDAAPRVESIRPGGPNKPYEMLGREYVPFTQDRAFKERGLASWYGRKFHGRMTSSGEPYDMYAMTAAHTTLPIPSYARIRNPANGREVLVRINDRGPFVAGRIVDLSYTAALKLDLLRGVAPVELERITFDDIRTGAWRGDRAPRNDVDPAPLQLASAAPPTTAQAMLPAPATSAAQAKALPDAEAVPAAQTIPPTTAQAQTTLPAPAPPTAATTVSTQDVVLVAVPPAAADSGRFWVQLGAFRVREGAETFRSRVGSDAAARWLEPLLVIVGDGAPYRVQAGPYRSRDEADTAAQRARAALALVPVVVERR